MSDQSLPSKHIYLGIDVSTSTFAHIEKIHYHIKESLHQIWIEGPFALAVYLFNGRVIPFPTRSLCRPRLFDEAFVPTLDYLKEHKGGGTAILDTLDLMIDDAIKYPASDRRIILLTDGWKRSSKKVDMPTLRPKIQENDTIDVSITGFTNQISADYLRRLVRELGLEDDACLVAVHHDDPPSVEESMEVMSKSMIELAQRTRSENATASSISH